MIEDDRELSPAESMHALEEFFRNGVPTSGRGGPHAAQTRQQPEGDQLEHPRARALEDQGGQEPQPQAKRGDRPGDGAQEQTLIGFDVAIGPSYSVFRCGLCLEVCSSAADAMRHVAEMHPAEFTRFPRWDCEG